MSQTITLNESFAISYATPHPFDGKQVRPRSYNVHTKISQQHNPQMCITGYRVACLFLCLRPWGARNMLSTAVSTAYAYSRIHGIAIERWVFGGEVQECGTMGESILGRLLLIQEWRELPQESWEGQGGLLEPYLINWSCDEKLDCGWYISKQQRIVKFMNLASMDNSVASDEGFTLVPMRLPRRCHGSTGHQRLSMRPTDEFPSGIFYTGIWKDVDISNFSSPSRLPLPSQNLCVLY